jgi:hypothetical protein
MTMKVFFVLVFLVLAGTSIVEGQNTISGVVRDAEGIPLAGANIFIKGEFDGAASNAEGHFQFETALSGEQVLVATFLGYQMQERHIMIKATNVAHFELAVAPGRIGDVVITVGLFEAGDQKKSITLNPLDIVTTPSAEGDIYGALMALPGTAVVGEDGRLFVRGGDGYESKTFVDGLLSKKPYSSSMPDLPSRGRFSPFLFTGTTFSTGGYSAEYGQALSSALILNTNSFPEKSQTELSFLSVGQGINQSFRDSSSSLSLGVNYFNLGPYYRLVPQKNDIHLAPRELALTMSARRLLRNQHMVKVFSTFSRSQFGLDFPNTTRPGTMAKLSIDNRNSYTNVNHSGELKNGWFIKSGMALTVDDNRLDLQYFKVDELNHNLQGKISARKQLSGGLKLVAGIEETFNRFRQDYYETETDFSNQSQFHDLGSALFTEMEWQPFARVATRIGLRGEHSSLLDKSQLALRLSAAYKLSAYGQVSGAYGNFYQTPEEPLLRFTNRLDFEQADHYIVNYQWERNNRVVRLETYLKNYSSLVVYDKEEFWKPEYYNNSGDGFSKGFELFYRDQQSIRFFDFWISYSYLESKRKYRDYPVKATPPFAPAHSFSFVGKYWLNTITTQLGLSTTIASGRPYHNPNKTGFMNALTPNYSNVSVNCSHLRTLWGKSTIIYLSVSNVLGRQNVFGHRYAEQPDANGVYQGYPVTPEADRFYLVGIFLTI